MPGRSTLLIAGLGAAIALPYLTSPSTGLRQWIARPSSGQENTKAENGAPSGSSPAAPQPGQPDQAAMHPEGPPVADLSEIFRFDIAPGWVMARWPRVTNRLATLDLNGYRVPLVTGTRTTDLAGSLTYYFDPEQRVKRITFIGHSGDPTPLIALLQSRYNFSRQVVPDPTLALYQVKKGRKAISEMRVRPVSTISATNPNGRFEVALVIERPGR